MSIAARKQLAPRVFKSLGPAETNDGREVEFLIGDEAQIRGRGCEFFQNHSGNKSSQRSTKTKIGSVAERQVSSCVVSANVEYLRPFEFRRVVVRRSDGHQHVRLSWNLRSAESHASSCATAPVHHRVVSCPANSSPNRMAETSC